ncbi:MAG TPA: GYF domain-containing protein, partial [Thermogutta sp.]|nr:GYF domain-containing protein [Thermogutta sp.]
MRLWYYAKGPNRFGPIEEAELRRRLGTGEIAAEDWLWTEGMSNWVKAAEWLRTAGDPVVEKPIVAEAVAGPSAAVVVTASPPPVNDLAAGSLSQRMLPVRELYERIEREVRKVFVGQDELVLGTLTALFSGGHVLIESVPGLGKTLFV